MLICNVALILALQEELASACDREVAHAETQLAVAQRTAQADCTALAAELFEWRHFADMAGQVMSEVSTDKDTISAEGVIIRKSGPTLIVTDTGNQQVRTVHRLSSVNNADHSGHRYPQFSWPTCQCELHS